jgi:hypothetical protein
MRFLFSFDGHDFVKLEPDSVTEENVKVLIHVFMLSNALLYISYLGYEAFLDSRSCIPDSLRNGQDFRDKAIVSGVGAQSAARKPVSNAQISKRTAATSNSTISIVLILSEKVRLFVIYDSLWTNKVCMRVNKGQLSMSTLLILLLLY